MSRFRRIQVLTVAVLASCVPAAHAAHFTYGSSLAGKATTVEHHSRDWAAFPTATVPKSRTYRAPAQGEVTQVTFKGTVLKPPNDAAYGGRYPAFNFHVVVLHPTGHGRMKLMVSTEDLPFPFGGDSQRKTTFRLQKYVARMCVRKGDVVALATSGGFGNHFPEYGSFPDDFFVGGYRVQMFSRQAGASSVGVFKQPAGTDTFQVGDTVPIAHQSGTELLMRTTIGTGRDARWTCRTTAQRTHNWPNPGV